MPTQMPLLLATLVTWVAKPPEEVVVPLVETASRRVEDQGAAVGLGQAAVPPIGPLMVTGLAGDYVDRPPLPPRV